MIEKKKNYDDELNGGGYGGAGKPRRAGAHGAFASPNEGSGDVQTPMSPVEPGYGGDEMTMARAGNESPNERFESNTGEGPSTGGAINSSPTSDEMTGSPSGGDPADMSGRTRLGAGGTGTGNVSDTSPTGGVGRPTGYVARPGGGNMDTPFPSGGHLPQGAKTDDVGVQNTSPQGGTGHSSGMSGNIGIPVTASGDAKDSPAGTMRDVGEGGGVTQGNAPGTTPRTGAIEAEPLADKDTARPNPNKRNAA